MTLKPLAARRRALIAKAQQQRVVLQQATADLRHSLAFAEQAVALATRLRRKPVLTAVTAAGVAVLVLSPRRALKWISYAATAYSLARRMRTLLSGSAR